MKINEKIQYFNQDNIDLMKTLSDNSISLGITDIPYGIDVGNMSFVKEKKNTVKQKNGNRLNANRNKKMESSDWDKEIPNQEWFEQFTRVTKHQIFFGVEYVNWEGLGNGRIKWNKGFADGMSFKKYEMAYCSFINYTKEIDYLWAGMMQGKSILEPMTQQGNKKLNEKRIHPTQKPILLWDLIFLFCISEGIDISSVLDTNAGLASLGISALKFNEIKNVILCDISKNYFEKATNRIINHISQQKIIFN